MKSARFFCESCGRAVPFNADMCPNCGKTFDAVKCPVCKYTGMPGEFLKGCPQCGYLADDSDDAEHAPPIGRSSGMSAAKRPAGDTAREPLSKSRRSLRSERDIELFKESQAKVRHPLHSWSYYLILVLLFAILISMGIFLIMIM